MATLDVGQAGQAAGTYGIKTIPTTIFFVNGKEVNRIEGGATKEELLAEISRISGAAPQPQAGPVQPPAGPAVVPAPRAMPMPSGSPTGTLVAVGSIAAAVLLTALLLR